MDSNYKSPLKLSNIVMVIIGLSILLGIAAIVSDVMELSLLANVREGLSISEGQAQSNDSRQAMIGLIQMLFGFLFVVFFLIWVYRANSNLNSLGTKLKGFSPGWAVGWFFIPIANYFKPYQAIKEIWIQSTSYNENKTESNPSYSIVIIWWFFWVVQSIAARFILRFAFNSNSIDDLYTSSIVQIFSEVLDIIVNCLTALIVLKVSSQQEEKHKTHLEFSNEQNSENNSFLC